MTKTSSIISSSTSFSNNRYPNCVSGNGKSHLLLGGNVSRARCARLRAETWESKTVSCVELMEIVSVAEDLYAFSHADFRIHLRIRTRRGSIIEIEAI